MAVKATFQIDLGKQSTTDQSGDASIELDSRKDGFNGGKTEFRGGDTIYFLLHVPPGAVIEEIITNEGDAKEYGGIQLDTADILVFDYPDETSQRLSRAPSGSVGMAWVGKGLPVSPSHNNGVVTLPTSIGASKRAIGMLNCKYTEQVKVVKLTTPATVDNNPNYSIHGVVVGYIQQDAGA
ncbi:MAG: hypothetical protein PHP00_06935 [Thiotrichaceae bacterium]|nr:hypothetical protein [Thiotrichaceae bacterium]